MEVVFKKVVPLQAQLVGDNSVKVLIQPTQLLAEVQLLQ